MMIRRPAGRRRGREPRRWTTAAAAAAPAPASPLSTRVVAVAAVVVGGFFPAQLEPDAQHELRLQLQRVPTLHRTRRRPLALASPYRRLTPTSAGWRLVIRHRLSGTLCLATHSPDPNR